MAEPGKVCSKCETWKPLTEFYKRTAAADGLAHQCEACNKKRCQTNYRANRERVKARNKAYYGANRAAICARGRAQSRAYYRANPDKARERAARRRARKAGADGSHTRAEFRASCEQFGWACLCCGVPHEESPLTVDHVIPLSAGGSDDISNLQPLCIFCNTSKGTKTIDYRGEEEAVVDTRNA